MSRRDLVLSITPGSRSAIYVMLLTGNRTSNRWITTAKHLVSDKWGPPLSFGLSLQEMRSAAMDEEHVQE